MECQSNSRRHGCLAKEAVEEEPKSPARDGPTLIECKTYRYLGTPKVTPGLPN